MVKRVLCFSLIFLLLMSINISAEEEKIDCADEYRDMLDALPDEIAELLPDKLFSDKITDIAEGAREAVSLRYILEIAASYIGLELRGVIKLFAGMLGILILSALINSVKSSFSSRGISDSFSMISSFVMFLTAFGTECVIVESVAAFFDRLCYFANSILPLTAALYAMGGNVASAVVHHSSLLIFMNLVENFCAKSAVPVTGICMSFCAVNTIAPEINLGSLTAFFKKTYTQVLAFLMTVFMTVMGAQSLLAGKTDTLAGKATKFAVGNLIPTVGSALSGTLGTVASSVEYIRASVGIIGIVVIILMLVPTLVTLFLSKLSFALLESAADILGCGNEKKMISELAGINGFLLALASICSVSLIFIITLFVKCSAAAGGGNL